MDRKTYETTTNGEFKGRKVINLVPLTNGLYKFPPGMTWTIERKQGGFDLLSDSCPHCGIQARVTKTPAHAVDFTDQQNLWPMLTKGNQR